jgi:hypothetical protein
MTALSNRDRRALLLGALTLSSILIAARGMPLWRESAVQSLAAADGAITHAILAASLAQRGDEIRSTLEARRASYLSLAPMLIAGETVAMAAAALASQVSRFAMEAGVDVGMMATQVDSTGAGSFATVTVVASGAGDVASLASVLESIQRARQVIVVRELAVDQPEPEAASDSPEQLRITLRVSGLALRNARGARP